MTQAVLFMAILPFALAMVLGLALFGGRLKPDTRIKVERGMAAVFYPLITLYWLWRAYDFAGEGRGINAAMMVGVGCLFAWMGVRAVRSGHLAPVASPTR